jgi:hypothetical protein
MEQLSWQTPAALQVPEPLLQVAPVFGALVQVVAGGASHESIVHSLPSSQDPSGSACALQSEEVQTPAWQDAGGGALVQAEPSATLGFEQTAAPDESSQTLDVQSLPSSQKPGPAA